jgi:hypothetical protein
MKLADAIKEMEENLIRYKHEAETGTRLNGNPMDDKQIERRKKSIPKLEEMLAVLKKWKSAKARGDSLILPLERQLIAMYDLDISEFTTPVQMI